MPKMLCAFSKKILPKIKITPHPAVRSALKPSQMGLMCTGSDGVSERSRKIRQPENDLGQGVEHVPYSRQSQSCTRLMIFILFALCGFGSSRSDRNELEQLSFVLGRF